MFEGLIDYAGLFPPAKLAMDPAVEEYLHERDGRFAPMLGRFIVPASRIDELLAVLTQPIPVSVIVDAGTDPRTWMANASSIGERLAALRSGETRISIDVLEVPLPPLLSLRESYDASIGQWAMIAERYGLRDLPAFVEIPRDARYAEQLPGAIAALARYGLGAKVRCGSVDGDAPSPETLARFIALSAEESVPFKATAGLHHPVRHYNGAAGYTMHGFLNVLAAAARAHDGIDEVERILAAENDAAFRALTPAEVAAGRARFISYGSCSFSEPVEDLIALGLLQQNA